jgi:hypothetical protein
MQSNLLERVNAQNLQSSVEAIYLDEAASHGLTQPVADTYEKLCAKQSEFFKSVKIEFYENPNLYQKHLAFGLLNVARASRLRG